MLGAMMILPGAITDVVEKVRENDFYLDSQRLIFRAIVDLFNSGNPVDPITVTESLSASGVIDKVGGKAYIHTLVSTVPAASNAVHYADIVRENSLLRSLIRVGSEIAQAGYERTGDVSQILDECEMKMFEISQHQIRGEFRSIEDLVGDLYEKFGVLKASGKSVTGTPTNFPTLDKKTAGLQKSNLIILAARPAVGKTSLALDITQNVAINNNIPVAFFSLEMSADELGQRMISAQAKFDSQRLRIGAIKKDEWNIISDACDRLSRAPIFVDDTPGINMLEIRAKTRRLASKHPLGLVVVDYLQLMMTDRRAQNREQEIAQISRSLKIMAREIQVPVLALSQLSRAPEIRRSKPILSDLRESGAIEQDADVVLFLHKQQKENDDNGQSNQDQVITELEIAKHRNGPTGTINLVFRNTYSSFIESEERF